MTKDFNVKAEILKEISATNDPAMRTILMLLLGVFEDIGDKIDNILGNENAIREAVLNGHAPVHHGHHEWLAERIGRDAEIEVLVAWAKGHMDEETEAKNSARKIRDGVLEKLIAALILTGAGGLTGFLLARLGG